jgi:acetyl esterase/lipase
MGRTTIHYGAHHSQVGDLWLPADAAGDLPVVVLIHGGFWRAQFTKALMGRLARAVTARGWAAWNIEYRRVGVFGGGGDGRPLSTTSPPPSIPWRRFPG